MDSLGDGCTEESTLDVFKVLLESDAVRSPVEEAAKVTLGPKDKLENPVKVLESDDGSDEEGMMYALLVVTVLLE